MYFGAPDVIQPCLVFRKWLLFNNYIIFNVRGAFMLLRLVPSVTVVYHVNITKEWVSTDLLSLSIIWQHDNDLLIAFSQSNSIQYFYFTWISHTIT